MDDVDIVSWAPAVATQEGSGHWRIAPSGSAVAHPTQLNLAGWLHTPANARQGEIMAVLGYDAREHLLRAWLPVAAAADDRRRRAARACAAALSAALGCPVRIVPVPHTAGRLHGGESNTAIIAAVAAG